MSSGQVRSFSRGRRFIVFPNDLRSLNRLLAGSIGADFMNLIRRKLGKWIAAGLGASLLGPIPPWETAFAQESTSVPSSEWKVVLPGIWSVRIGNPEPITPVTSRLVPTAANVLERLPHIPSAPLPRPLAKVGPRGTTFRLPLEPQEQMYGFGLQFFSVNHRGKKRVMRVNADPPEGHR